MIENVGKYYVYRHVRLDKKEVFYIGIGTKLESNYYRTIYKRAFCNHRENSVWKRIVNKTDYEVEILIESNNYDFIREKEVELITLYGRINLGEGTLSNLTDGGEGVKGRVPTKEWRENHSKKMTGRKGNKGRLGKKHSEETKRKISEANKGKAMKEESKLKLSKTAIERGIHKGENNNMYGRTYGNAPKARKVINTKTLVIYDSIKRAAEEEGINISTLGGYLTNRIHNKTDLIYLEQYSPQMRDKLDI